MTTTGIHLTWSPKWRLDFTDDADPILVAGADRRLRLHGIAPAQKDALRQWAAGTGEERLQIANNERDLADRLVDVGALVAEHDDTTIRAVGDAVFGAKLLQAMKRNPANDDDAGLSLLIRTSDQWPEPPAAPHLAVDCSLHHTLVFGPFVIPGFSACTSCLTVRMARRWPDVKTAAAPAMQERVHLIAEIVSIHADLIAGGVSPLVNATMAWDFEQGTCERQTLLKSPGCPHCDLRRPSGQIALPWSGGLR